MATDTIYLRVDPALKSWLVTEATRAGETMQAFIIKALHEVQKKSARQAKKPLTR